MPRPLAHQTVGPTKVDLLDGGVRFVFPSRKIGRLRLVGLVMMVVAVLLATGPAGVIIGALRNDMPIVLMLLPLLFFIPIVIAFGLGAFIYAGRSEIELTRRHLRYTEWAGPLRKRWTCPLEDLTSLRVVCFSGAGVRKTGDAPSAALPAALNDMGAIIAPRGDGKRLVMAPGYDFDMLLPVARELAGRSGAFLPRPIAIQIGAEGSAAATTSAAMSWSSAAGEGGAITLDALPDPPAKATARLERHDAGLTIHIPPAGVWRGSKGLFVFGLFWLFICLIPSALMLDEIRDGEWFLVLFPVVFWGVGIAMLVGGIAMGKRQAIIDIIGDTLVITQQGLFGTKQHEWTRDQLEDICVGPSGMKVNNRPVMNLHIVPHEGSRVCLFSERRDDELHWTAQALRAGLGLNQSATTSLHSPG